MNIKKICDSVEEPFMVNSVQDIADYCSLFEEDPDHIINQEFFLGKDTIKIVSSLTEPWKLTVNDYTWREPIHSYTQLAKSLKFELDRDHKMKWSKVDDLQSVNDLTKVSSVSELVALCEDQNALTDEFSQGFLLNGNKIVLIHHDDYPFTIQVNGEEYSDDFTSYTQLEAAIEEGLEVVATKVSDDHRERVEQKDVDRMISLINKNDTEGTSVAATIKDKNKAVARYVAGLILLGEELPLQNKIGKEGSFLPLCNKALELGATWADIRFMYNTNLRFCENQRDKIRREPTDVRYRTLTQFFDRAKIPYEVDLQDTSLLHFLVRVSFTEKSDWRDLLVDSHISGNTTKFKVIQWPIVEEGELYENTYSGGSVLAKALIKEYRKR